MYTSLVTLHSKQALIMCYVPCTLTAFISASDGRVTSTIAAVWMTTLAFFRTALTFIKRIKVMNTQFLSYCLTLQFDSKEVFWNLH